jgi:hypothetical protein
LGQTWAVMKFSVIVLIAMLAAASGLAQEVARTWTDLQGRTLTGVFVEANTQEITVQREDGSVVHLARTLLSPDDLAYADKAQAAKPITLTIGASRARFGSKRSETPGEVVTVEDWGYSFTLTNSSGLTGQNLRADYRLFYRRTKEAGVGDPVTQPLVHQSGTEDIAKLDPKGTLTFRTSAVSVTSTQLVEGTWLATGTSTFVNTKFEGIWLRVYQNDKQIGEYLSSEELRKDGWPGATPAAKAGRKKPVTAPAP